MFRPSTLQEALEALGALLEARGLHYQLVVVGGSSLLLLGLITRSTRDLDVLALVKSGHYLSAEPLPSELQRASNDVAGALGLAEDWLNPGPTDLLKLGLPLGFEKRVEMKSYGGLVVQIAGRFDQICLKLYAAVDQGSRSKHFDDLCRLQPIREELLAAARWTRTHDPSEGFHDELLEILTALGVENVDDDI